MIVRCSSTLSPLGDELTHYEEITIGDDYVVLTIYAAPERDVLLRVLGVKPELRWPTRGIPPLWRSQMFELLSSEIPSNWRVEIDPGGAVRLEPESWLRPGFWEDLVDWSTQSESAQRDFDRELQIILDESGVR